MSASRAGLAALSTPWVQRALAGGAVLGLVWTLLPDDPSLADRAARDLLLFAVVPAALAVAHGRRLGWRVDRRALRNAALLAAFVTPFYVVGSTLPTVRAFYPMWATSTALSAFLPHVLAQFLVALAAETYYRGLLCVGVRELGPVAVLLSPVVYVLHHAGKPPVELLLSGPTDVLFGAVDYRSRSILPSVVAHGLGLALLDWLVLHPPVIASARVLSALRWVPLPLSL